MKICLDEDLITFHQASTKLPNRPHVSSFARWSKKGIRKGPHIVRLETLVIAGRVYTSVQALERFVAATTAAANAEPVPVRTPMAREKAIEQAEREMGVAEEPGEGTTK